VVIWLAEAGFHLFEPSFSLSGLSQKLLEKAPKGRNIIAWGIALGNKSLSLSQALKGRNKVSRPDRA
jgi:hypothetical protein